MDHRRAHLETIVAIAKTRQVLIKEARGGGVGGDDKKHVEGEKMKEKPLLLFTCERERNEEEKETKVERSLT